MSHSSSRREASTRSARRRGADATSSAARGSCSAANPNDVREPTASELALVDARSGALEVGVLEVRRVLQAVADGAVHADVGEPDQAQLQRDVAVSEVAAGGERQG